ncbi:hypothetical protein PAT3040_03989 [Paenibacillus agaridevorans]|uniref:Uncharacterized protein n=1 Tax=Paenibacillus agaridevorans TaxID=171404 RepID=A0A2R5ET83_9BACL|nr:hypothetical protein [Paenibacillus agaridevorans]GBG09345.1 hypothetical protein PAT3040_03989 [Paenibacillus agaridevorans]
MPSTDASSQMEQIVWFDDLPFTMASSPAERRRSNIRQFLVTERNIAEIPWDWLNLRYTKLKRWIRTSPQPKAEWLEEYDIITDYLQRCDRLQNCQPEGEQLTMAMEPVSRHSYVWLVEERLREQHRLRVEHAWLSKAVKEADDRYETCTTALYGNLAPGRSLDARSPVENRVMQLLMRDNRLQHQLEELEFAMLPIERIMRYKLSADQRELIERKYFYREQPKDEELIQRLHVGRQKYYTIKKQALNRIAYELKII